MEALTVREIEERDINSIITYWLKSDPGYLKGMGVELSKLPAQSQWQSMLSEQLEQAYEQKQSYCIIWQVDGKPVGHSNVNKIVFGEEAYMHLHLWHGNLRKLGFGTNLVKMTLPYFFENLKLKTLFCEPYALNPAPHKTLEKVGFKFVKEYTTTPGSINFEQPVIRWKLTYKDFKNLEQKQ